MAIGSTIYNFDISLSDTARGVYEELSFRAARHSSETLEYLLCRVIAYCLEYKEGIEFTKGLDDPELPAVWAKDLTGRITDWVEIGTPSPEKLHKASKHAARVVVYTHKNPEITLDLLKSHKIHRSADIGINSLDPKFISEISVITQKNNRWELTLSEGALYLQINGRDLTSHLNSARLT